MPRRENPHPGERDAETSAQCERRKDDSRNRHLRFERLISDLSARFVNIAPDQVDGEIEAALKQVLDFFQVDRCGLLGTRPDKKFAYVMHACYGEGIARVAGDINLAVLFPYNYEKLFVQGVPVITTKLEDMPPEAETDRQTYAAMGVRSSLDIPVLIKGRAGHVILIQSLREERSWPEIYIPRLRLLGEIFINALERKRADQALRESEALLNLATDSAGASLWSMDVGTSLVSVLPRTRDLFGFPQDEKLTYESFLRVIHPEDREMVHLCVEKAIQAKGAVNIEYRIVLPNGTIRWISARGRCHCTPSGEIERLMGLSVDITDRKLAEAARRESMERYSAIVEAFDGLIYICSPDYRVEFMNQRMIERTGRNAVGEPCYKALHDRDSICGWCVNERVFRGETVRWEVQSPKDHRWYYIVNTPIHHTDGTMSKQSMIMDITERKQAEEALRESETALRYSQKNLQMLAGRLISAQEEELRRLSRELHDDLTQRLAVLAIEAGKLELELNKAPQSLSGPSQKISQIKEQLISVSEDVHHISRQLHPSILDDLGLIRAIESECTAILKRGNVRVTFVREDVLPVIPGDIALCLYRVVQESLKNITKHSQAQSAEIFLKSADNNITLAIRDKGIGFDPAQVRQKPGLGLASMRERIQLVRGEFSITSQPGQGTAVSVRVPLTGSRT